MSYPGKLIFILWVSWSGKNTIIHEMLQTDLWLQEVISCKTRQLRPGEIDGKDYCYLTQEEFEKERDNGEFLEYALIHQMFRYATRKKDVIEKLQAGINVIKEIDIQWLISIAELHKDIREVTKSIFLNVDNDTMLQRINLRSQLSQDEIDHRLTSAAMERPLAEKYCTEFIDASGTREEVAATVYDLIKGYLSEGK